MNTLEFFFFYFFKHIRISSYFSTPFSELSISWHYLFIDFCMWSITLRMIWKWKNAEIWNWNKSSEYSQPRGSSLSLAMMEIQIQVLGEIVAANHKELIIKVAENISQSVIILAQRYSVCRLQFRRRAT